jgi:hypothetical protein
MLGLLVLLSRFTLSLAALRSTFTFLGLDPPTVNRLNGESFQQNALVSFKGYQYAAFYGSVAGANVNTTRHVSVARRKISDSSSFGGSSNWDILTLTDYNQTLDDGHDIVSMGLSEGDGTIHLGFDQHDNNLNYRVSRKGVALDPENVDWNPSIFSNIIVSLVSSTNVQAARITLSEYSSWTGIIGPECVLHCGHPLLPQFRRIQHVLECDLPPLFERSGRGHANGISSRTFRLGRRLALQLQLQDRQFYIDWTISRGSFPSELSPPGLLKLCRE